jgi:5-(carboxyamino)imidazole ribonucleotide synthase
MDTRTGLPVVGMVGAGQLARMTHQAAIALGQSLRVLAASPDDGAALVAPDVVLGQHTDLDALRAFADGCDVVTFDHEHVPTGHVRALAAAGHKVYPGADALVCAQDKQVMRERLTALGLPAPRWAPVKSADDIAAFAGTAGWPVIAKAARGGYDGRGVWVLDGPDAAADLVAQLRPPLSAPSQSASSCQKRGNGTGTPLIVEEKVALRRELAAVVARSPFGQVAAYPVVETVQRDGICVEVLAPAPDLPADRAVHAQELAIRIATELDVVGVLAVELFDTGTDVLINELAMRPHNSGHWTIEGARTSQFEQHLRAVLDYPLGATGLTAPAVVMANLLGGNPEAGDGTGLDERIHHLFAADPAIKIHLYGKSVRPGRKIGHVTALGNDLAEVRARAARAVAYLRDGVPADGGDQ